MVESVVNPYQQGAQLMRGISLTICRRSFLISTVAGIFGGRAMAQQAGDSANAAAGDVFPLLKCPACESPLGGTDKILREDNREIRACDQECLEKLQADYFSFLEAIDEEIIFEQGDDYPLKTCLVDGTPLEEKDGASFVFRNRLFRVCCDDCRYKIEEEPAKYFAKLNAAVVKAQKAAYPIETCIVSKQPLGKKTVDHVCANLLVRLADPDQIARFNERPGKYLEDLRELPKKGKEKAK